MQGDFARLQGQHASSRHKTPASQRVWIGFSLIQGAGRPSFHSREGSAQILRRPSQSATTLAPKLEPHEKGLVSNVGLRTNASCAQVWHLEGADYSITGTSRLQARWLRELITSLPPANRKDGEPCPVTPKNAVSTRQYASNSPTPRPQNMCGRFFKTSLGHGCGCGTWNLLRRNQGQQGDAADDSKGCAVEKHRRMADMVP